MKSLACIFGRHRWTIQVARGDEYNVCSRCGKVPKDTPTLDGYAEAEGIAARQSRIKAGSVQGP
jgi:hypothetical protein